MTGNCRQLGNASSCGELTGRKAEVVSRPSLLIPALLARRYVRQVIGASDQCLAVAVGGGYRRPVVPREGGVAACSHILECPPFFELVSMRETEFEGAGYGRREEAYSGANREPAASG
jgi:hypothetical protein